MATWNEGAFVRIDLADGKHSYARLMREPFIAFYDHAYESSENPEINTIAELPIAFTICVVTKTITSEHWKQIGAVPLEPELQKVPLMFRKDGLTGDISIYDDSLKNSMTDNPPVAKPEEYEGLEAAAVWASEHAEDRLNDYFNGRSNKWVESLKS